MLHLLLLCVLALGFQPVQDVQFESILVLPPAGPGGRAPFRPDAVQAEIAAGRWTAPNEGDQLSGRTWKELAPAADGAFTGRELSGGYAFASFGSGVERTAILEASGHGMLYFNGEPRTGDPYSTGNVRLPVKVRKGENHVLVQSGRGRLTMTLKAPPAPVSIDLADATLPDLLPSGAPGSGDRAVGGLVVINATDQWQRDLLASVACEGIALQVKVPPIPPLSTRKVPIWFTPPAHVGKDGQTEVEYRITLTSPALAPGDTPDAIVKLRVRTPAQTRKITFLSTIDGSVQYYCLNPGTTPSSQVDEPARALVLSLHGASVEATNQADAYRPKPSLDIVAPTNRRPFGFDWEDWGRLDALEVLSLATTSLKPDPARVYLTGHSMGGHGTWNIGATFPDKFAAIAPSAGWISFWSYGGAQEPTSPTPLEALFRRAMNPSDTLKLSRNYLQQGIYILHGDADDNVPVDQARQMRQHLAGYHADFAYYERPGAGHWWGNECLDWPPIFEFFAHHRRRDMAAADRVEFTTASPGVSATCQWATILQQEVQNDFSTINITLDRKSRTFTAKTTNVARLRLNLEHIEGGGAVYFKHDTGEIDITPEGNAAVDLIHSNNTWKVAGALSPSEKGPHRTGPFKHAVNHRCVLVYATGGSASDRAWAFNKARFDAETFWYRGNGALELVADADFTLEAFKDRSVLLYGNAATNAAWPLLLKDSPIQALPGRITAGPREFQGDDLCALFVRPRPDSASALVGVVAPTGPAGAHSANRVPYLASGIAYPDWTVFSSDVLEHGLAGVKAAGFFGNQWQVEEIVE